MVDRPDGRVGIVDWKTSTRPYERWEKERFAIQPLAYSTLVKAELGLDYYPPFTYVVMFRHTTDVLEPQVMELEVTKEILEELREIETEILGEIDALALAVRDAVSE